jgi:D-alanyl-D-alanine carboxypeptidase/D-alanyl-D-alanine-endopeptidase (penicillin-binding protein 4)
MRNTTAAGNVRAKTGTKTGVRALAGYVDTRDGERLGFAILANNFRAPSREVVDIIDTAVTRLADFSRE